MITAQNYQTYPSSYVVRRYGYQPKKIVLTFDDGPDPVYTPQILDILKREGVHATFFVVGQNAEINPGLVARIWDEGNELGNHTYTHPNLLQTSPERTLLEITATQRVIEAITGHTTALFRPPFAIDVEPRTGGELKSIVQSSQYNFLAVGEKNDPQDWNLVKPGKDGMTQPRTADDIVQSVWHDRDTGNVILLHDGGGNREATVAALPRLIEKLKANGYEFITVAQLRGVSRDSLFPPVSGRDYAMVEVDRYVFGISYVVQRVLVTLFGLSVFLGISRQVWMGALALMQYRKERQRDRERTLGFADSSSALPVSVVIAAYNEEKVIVRTIETVLGSDYPNLEVVVVDDGSRDRTSAVVAEHFADDVRVRCLRKENGGKASALNVGIAEATGEVIVALDADTLFAKETIARLVRHFADPNVGAVSGNVRVGNTNNLLTRWQSLEYITSQNFDRRAYDLLNCITVVPGAVGAWRRSAIQAVGGYTSDTLAEDADLTWKVRRAGWRILNDSTALAFTEAPESLKNLARQRYRWAFGTLQNLWKHRDACFRHGAFGWFAIPSLWMYQILFPAISPIMDLTVLWALAAGSFQHVALYYGLMLGVELLGAAFALKMDRGNWRLLPWLLLQRFVYRQMMYYVILKSVWAALRGGAVGWNKFERRGTVTVEPAA
jgi:cellulose synthase/poly-beta-1,6-N-acetylglucosamine synthase-like glycosyltransferase/peptidoglycan/xylan/chitin deacetylase (PgdA/CDA1 family)